MNTATAPLTIDISGTPRTPFSRLVRTELRKTWDTRAGFWLLIATGVLTGLVMVIQLIVVLAQDLVVTYNDFLTSTNFSIGFLLPVIGILLLTSEWSQRTAMVSFSLEPHRSRVIGAKATVALLLAVAAVVVALVLAAVCNLVLNAASDLGGDWDLSFQQTWYFVLLQVIGMMTGFAFAALLLNSPAAIVLFMVYSFVLPGLFEIGASLIGWFEDLRPWVDFGYAQSPLFDGSGMDSKDWAYFAVSGFIWLVIPLVIGVRRVLRAEVK